MLLVAAGLVGRGRAPRIRTRGAETNSEKEVYTKLEYGFRLNSILALASLSLDSYAPRPALLSLALCTVGSACARALQLWSCVLGERKKRFLELTQN